MWKIEKILYTYIYSKMDEKKINERKQELSELKKLRELFEYTYEVQDITWDIRAILQSFPQEYLGLIIKVLELYKKELIENSFRAYPMDIDALNCRNGSVTVLGDLIKLVSWFRHKTQDMEYRDDGTLRENLRKANERLKENPLDKLK